MRYKLLTLALAAMLAVSAGMVAADAPTEHEAESIDLDDVDLELVDKTAASTIGFDDVDLEIVDDTSESDQTVEETEIDLDGWEEVSEGTLWERVDGERKEVTHVGTDTVYYSDDE